MQVWPGSPYPLGATYDGRGTNFALFSEVAERVELCLFDDEPQRDPRRGHRGRRPRLALLPAPGRPGPALRLPRARPLRPRRGAALQPEQAAARPVREGHRRHHRVGPAAVRLQLRRRAIPQRRGLGAPDDARRVDQPVLRLDRRPPAVRPLQREPDLRGPREGAHPAAPRRAGGAARHLRRAGAPGGDRAPAGPRASRPSS